MSVVTVHMVYFCAFARSEIFQKNARKSGVGRGQFDAGVNGLIETLVIKTFTSLFPSDFKSLFVWHLTVMYTADKGG